MEYDDDRSGDFRPLRYLKKGRIVVLGLVTTKFGQLETKDDAEAPHRRSREVRADRAAVPVSPQCGFSSTVHGNNIAVEDQRRKLGWSWRPRGKSGVGESLRPARLADSARRLRAIALPTCSPTRSNKGTTSSAKDDFELRRTGRKRERISLHAPTKWQDRRKGVRRRCWWHAGPPCEATRPLLGLPKLEQRLNSVIRSDHTRSLVANRARKLVGPLREKREAPPSACHRLGDASRLSSL